MKLAYEVLDLPTAHAFRIAREPARLRRSVWVRLTDADGTAGWGEAAATPFYGESAETVLRALELVRALVEAEPGPASEGQIEHLEQAIRRALGEQPAACAALSAALHDLLGKRLESPLWRLWELEPYASTSSYTLSIEAPDELRRMLQETRSYPVLKLKVGSGDDEAALRVVREERPDAVLRVDANTGWSVETASSLLDMLAGYEVELIEQPLPAEDIEGLKRIRALSPIPIIADESARVLEDVHRLAGAVDGINIKLAKCGSLREAHRMIDAARAYDMQVMLGCMVETTLGIAAAVQLAPRCDCIDLDGAVLLARDPFRGPGIDEAGEVCFNDAPGLGVTRAPA